MCYIIPKTKRHLNLAPAIDIGHPTYIETNNQDLITEKTDNRMRTIERGAQESVIFNCVNPIAWLQGPVAQRRPRLTKPAPRYVSPT